MYFRAALIALGSQRYERPPPQTAWLPFSMDKEQAQSKEARSREVNLCGRSTSKRKPRS
ncbi:hypothetical protein [Streptomyces sp. NPDC099088]|uniref:hypothetical protein n=1 Tax=Streptomyces sp. NPDC099088 TaxID=3366101 RepID=UPI00380EAFDF